MKLQSQLFEESLRPAIILHLGTMLTDPEAVPEVLEEAFEEDSDVIYEAVGVDSTYAGDDFYIVYDLIDEADKLDYLVKFETPIPTQFFGDGGVGYSWGYYTSKWFYGKTYNECCKKAIKWRRQWIEDQIKENSK